ncbi:hypothetical protein BS50DRAFT_567594 [Corynespora cassiicola Philippines]|uniref:Uncharacterized protein n=1 Tax=Corynespora cassiicola Philippines TaxID=1448308 RepID=A0A2T2PAY1_CORCC|nr:hypothetical protein BS50DRAFT_567594 [Corynespora cassiicola Philippines]
MKLTTTQAASAVIFTLLPAASANSCSYKMNQFSTPNVTIPTSISYDVWAQNVYDISGICGGLWDNLKRFGVCATPSQTYCGGIESTHILNWRFSVTIGCNEGMVHSTWWEATKNNFGSINCLPA